MGEYTIRKTAGVLGISSSAYSQAKKEASGGRRKGIKKRQALGKYFEEFMPICRYMTDQGYYCRVVNFKQEVLYESDDQNGQRVVTDFTEESGLN
jgi:hypothetical protein